MVTTASRPYLRTVRPIRDRSCPELVSGNLSIELLTRYRFFVPPYESFASASIPTI